jgi:hypothetical protein
VCYEDIRRGNSNNVLEISRVNRISIRDDGFDHSLSADEKKQAALRYIMEAWEEAVFDGIEPELLANAAFFAAISDLVTSYGEDAVARMTDGLARRIHNGEFTLYRITQ